MQTPHEPTVTLFDKLKKWADILDDIFSACRSLIPPFVIELVSPLLIGSLFGIIGAGEGYQAKKELKEIKSRGDDDRPLTPEQREAEKKVEILVRNYIQTISVVIFGLSATLILSGVASGLNATPVGNDGVADWLNHSEKAANIDAYNFIIVIFVLSIYMARLVEKSQKFHHSRHVQNDPESSNISKALGFQITEVCGYGLVCIGIGAATGVITGSLLTKTLNNVSIGPLELDITPGFILLITGVAVGILSKQLESRFGPHERKKPSQLEQASVQGSLSRPNSRASLLPEPSGVEEQDEAKSELYDSARSTGSNPGNNSNAMFTRSSSEFGRLLNETATVPRSASAHR